MLAVGPQLGERGGEASPEVPAVGPRLVERGGTEALQHDPAVQQLHLTEALQHDPAVQQLHLQALRHEGERQVGGRADLELQGPEAADQQELVAEEQLPVETVRCRGGRGWRLEGPRMPMGATAWGSSFDGF